MVRLQLPPAPPAPSAKMEDGSWKMGGPRDDFCSGLRQLLSSISHLLTSILSAGAGSSNRRTASFEGANAGAIPAPAANFRPVVKQDHVCPTNRCWGCNSLPGDQPSLFELRIGEPLPAAPAQSAKAGLVA